MATRHSSRRTKAEQWLFGVKWRGTPKETKNTVIPEAKPQNPNTIEKDEGICFEKSRVHLFDTGQRETIDVPGRRSDVAKTVEKDEGICFEKSRLHLYGLGRREIMDVAPGRRSDVAKTFDKDEDICLEKSRVYLHGPGRRQTMDIVPGRRSDVEPGRRSMPEMEINIKEVIAMLGVKVMAADMPPFMQLHAFRCAKRSFDSLEKFSSRQLAHDVKKVSCDLALYS
ncbi:hypothetical protein PR202_gb05860 [Eleusine coracana subsp. coracana]|uniref:Dynein light chain n=1 Tax=Eleusine coracana subsp. coracana TaxID=191504 RepID=A0AAV5E826_ELECO|nr:hypothetical protein PR202_gb05860 [Eleusine coracana subsp. coracana]